MARKNSSKSDSVAAMTKYRPPTTFTPLAVEVLGGAEAWDWREDGSPCTGVIRDVRVVTTKGFEDGPPRKRARVILDVADDAGEVTKRAIFLPEEYGAPLIKVGAGRWVQVTRDGEGLDARYGVGVGA